MKCLKREQMGGGMRGFMGRRLPGRGNLATARQIRRPAEKTRRLRDDPKHKLKLRGVECPHELACHSSQTR